MLYALGFIGLFTIGGLTGLFLASLAIDVHVHDTYFVVAHFHYIMVGGAVMAYLGGIHFWWPKMTGRMYPELWGKLSALTIFVGFNLTFFPQFVLGYLGMPRRYYEYPPEFQVLNVMSTAGASILAVGYLLPLVYLLLSLWLGAGGRRQPVARHGPGVADRLAAADAQLRRDARRHRGALRLPEQRGGWTRDRRHDRRTRARAPADDDPTLAHQFDDPEQQQRGGDAGDVGVPGHRGHVLRRPVRGLRRLPVHRPRRRSRWPAAQLNVWLGSINTVVLLTSSLTMALAVRAGQHGRPQAAGPLPAADDGPGDRFLGIKGVRVLRGVREAPGPRA